MFHFLPGTERRVFDGIRPPFNQAVQPPNTPRLIRPLDLAAPPVETSEFDLRQINFDAGEYAHLNIANANGIELNDDIELNRANVMNNPRRAKLPDFTQKNCRAWVTAATGLFAAEWGRSARRTENT